MHLSPAECWRRLDAARHGVLSTVHPDRGVDAVPCVFAVAGERLLVPIDTVKPKRTGAELQRVKNIQRDRRCVLLVDHYESDWDRLWWVRLHADAAPAADPAAWLEHLAARYPPYAQPGAVEAVLLLTPTAISGWSAGD